MILILQRNCYTNESFAKLYSHACRSPEYLLARQKKNEVLCICIKKLKTKKETKERIEIFHSIY